MSDRIPSIGTLTDRVQLKVRGDVDFVPLATVWARMRSVASGLGTHVLVLRFRQDIQAGDRVVYRGRQFDIIEAGDLNGRKAYLRVVCNELTMAGAA